MTDKTERDALVALAGEVREALKSPDVKIPVWHRLQGLPEEIEALAAPAEGGQYAGAVERIAALLHEEATDEPWTVAGVEHPGPDRAHYRKLARKVIALATPPAASVDVEGLRAIADGIDPATGTMGCKEVADLLRKLIDSAGGARGRVPPGYTTDKDGSIVPGSVYDDDERNTPQPAEGDGAVAGNIPSRLFVHPHPLEPDEKVAEQRKFAAGWNACVSAYEGAAALTRPSAAAVPEGCTPEDARMLRAANHGLAEESARFREALEYYASRRHFAISDSEVWDTVSGEPENLWCDEAGTATVEDGAVARHALAAAPAAPKGGVVDEAVFAEQVMAYMDRHGVTKITWGDMAALSQQDNTAAADAAPKGVDGFDAWFDEYSKQNYDDYMLARAAWDAALATGDQS